MNEKQPPSESSEVTLVFFTNFPTLEETVSHLPMSIKEKKRKSEVGEFF